MTDSFRKTKTQRHGLDRFGFCFGKGGAHTSRTIMLQELGTLLTCVDIVNSGRSDYYRNIVDENRLGKRSAKTRQLTYNHLVSLYSLDPSYTLYRTLLYFWQRDVAGQSFLALLCAYSRDSLLRMSAPFILSFSEGSIVTREALESFIDQKEPGRFSKATLKSTAQNLNASWTNSGHLVGHFRKIRSRATPTAGSVSYALFLGYLNGARGEGLFTTEYVKVLDCSRDRLIELAAEASIKGWIVFKRVGNIMEVLFPNLLTQQEMEWVREQAYEQD
ncbi:MAG: hypothetical protein ACYDBP_03010 [Leptospirales bacterium]